MSEPIRARTRAEEADGYSASCDADVLKAKAIMQDAGVEFNPDSDVAECLARGWVDALTEAKALRARAEEAKRELDASRRFPIQDGPSILWSVIAPHEAQAQRNHRQSLERLAQRGGLGPIEAIAVVEGLTWRELRDRYTNGEARARFRALVERTDAEHSALAKRLREAERDRAWQPIETAPRDGTAIAIVTRGGWVFKAQWWFIDADIGYAWVCSEEGTAPPSWTDGQCWALNEDNEPSDPPAYWMPLPPEPSDASSANSKGGA